VSLKLYKNFYARRQPANLWLRDSCRGKLRLKRLPQPRYEKIMGRQAMSNFISIARAAINGSNTHPPSAAAAFKFRLSRKISHREA
jgi:hypothetical protein